MRLSPVLLAASCLLAACAATDWRPDDEAAARRQLALAMDNSLTRSQHDLYAATLAWLQAHRLR